MMKQISICLLFLFGILLQNSAQITVAEDNNVGIGESSPVSELSINGTGNTYSTLYVENNTLTSNQRAAHFYKSASEDTGSDYSFSLFANIAFNGGFKLVGAQLQSYTTTSTNYRTFGVRGVAGNGYNGYNYAVFGALLGDRNGAGVYGTYNGIETSIPGKYAGYFNGPVHIAGLLTVNTTSYYSDTILKKDIKYLSDEDVRQIDKLKSLTAIKYKFKNPAELDNFDQAVLDTAKVDPRTMEYSEEKYTRENIGFSAQEVQPVFPELVSEGQDGYLTMNYIGLIPVLVEAVKEQDEVIDKLQEELKAQSDELTAIRKEIESLKSLTGSK